MYDRKYYNIHGELRYKLNKTLIWTCLSNQTHCWLFLYNSKPQVVLLNDPSINTSQVNTSDVNKVISFCIDWFLFNNKEAKS